LAEELLYQSKHPVYMSVGSGGRRPRRYRGRDVVWWMFTMADTRGRMTVDQLPSPRARYAANPHLSGKNGGHEINLRHLRRDGATLVGRLLGLKDGRLIFASDLEHNLAHADDFSTKFRRDVDEFIDDMSWTVPRDAEISGPALRETSAPPILELDLEQLGITSMIWATGYQPDFSWVQFPICDEYAYPIQRRG